MNEFSVRCRISKKDRAMLSAYSIMHSPALMFLTVIFLVILVYLPTAALFRRMLFGDVDLRLVLYVISLVAMLFVNIRSMIFLPDTGVSEYIFSDIGFSVSDSQGKSFVQYQQVISLTEAKRHFFIYISKNSAYIIPKAYLNPNDGEKLREIFGAKTKGRKCGDSFYGEKTAEGGSRIGAEYAYKTSEIRISDDYPKKAAVAILAAPASVINTIYIFMIFMLLSLIWLPSVLAWVAVVYTLLVLISSFRKNAAAIKSHIDQCGTAVYRFCGSGFEYLGGGNTSRFEYEKIIGIKKKSNIIKIKLKNGLRYILPVSDDIYDEIEKNLHTERK